jgi:hypothetical protein
MKKGSKFTHLEPMIDSKFSLEIPYCVAAQLEDEDLGIDSMASDPQHTEIGGIDAAHLLPHLLEMRNSKAGTAAQRGSSLGAGTATQHRSHRPGARACENRKARKR